jgi:5-methylcytosine-specific restriction endonuclease McrA
VEHGRVAPLQVERDSRGDVDAREVEPAPRTRGRVQHVVLLWLEDSVAAVAADLGVDVGEGSQRHGAGQNEHERAGHRDLLVFGTKLPQVYRPLVFTTQFSTTTLLITMVDSPVSQFICQEPSLEDYWRSIILFGRNVASYKFALGKSLIELSRVGRDLVTLEDLAEPFSRHLCEHLQHADKQATSTQSRFLEVCRQFNRREISRDALLVTTARLGFANVIDAFHIVGPGEVPTRFFLDERQGRQGGIRITDQLRQLAERFQFQNLPEEIEARWRLVETAWELNLPRHAVEITYDANGQGLYVPTAGVRRRNITGCREALNGYQKGFCFYCGRDMIVGRSHIDHFLPHSLMRAHVLAGLDGVWNLVLACADCNSGRGGKTDRVPCLRYLERLEARSEYLIGSHHPLRETLLLQLGATRSARRQFLQDRWNEAHRHRPGQWQPSYEEPRSW